jgi:hypothetical protein
VLSQRYDPGVDGIRDVDEVARVARIDHVRVFDCGRGQFQFAEDPLVGGVAAGVENR